VTVALERALSKLGLATRSEARRLILEGRVRIDGHQVGNPLAPVIPEELAIEIDGRAVEPPRRVTIALHKPRGVVTTRRDPEGRKTVYDFLRDCPHRLVPIGRLDYATSGLLLLTNDTRLADWLLDPANAVPRVYLVTVRGALTAAEARALETGVDSSAGGRKERLRAHTARVRKMSNRETHLVLELIEGKNREVRRLLAATGHQVTQLRRVQFGGITLGPLAPGAWRVLSDAELRQAFPNALFSQKKLRTRPRRH
jgi:23S rRNA pseudouridine2605 synthase